MAAFEGTAIAVTWASGSAPAAQSITIPSGATAVCMLWAMNTTNTGNGMASATLNSITPDINFEIPEQSNGNPATGVCVWYNPSTGAQDLEVSWDDVPDEGPVTGVCYVSGVGEAQDYDGDSDPATPNTEQSVTIDSDTDGLVIKMDQRFGGGPSVSTGWTSLVNGNNAGQYFEMSDKDSPGASTSVCDSEGEFYSSVIAISFPDGSLSAGATPRRLRRQVGFV